MMGAWSTEWEFSYNAITGQPTIEKVDDFWCIEIRPKEERRKVRVTSFCTRFTRFLDFIIFLVEFVQKILQTSNIILSSSISELTKKARTLWWTPIRQGRETRFIDFVTRFGRTCVESGG